MNISELSKNYIKCFEDIHEQYNFTKEPAVKVSSRIDLSVFLIGSTISVLKPYFCNGICTAKRYIVQPAIRTQQLSNMENDIDNGSCYGSFFFAMGDLAPYSCLEEVFDVAVGFLREIFKDGTQKFIFRTASKDVDLLRCSQKYEDVCLTEIDSRAEEYYRHHYGMNDEGIFGRNCNIAVAQAEGMEYKDIANIIVIEKNGFPFAVELAVGLSPLICHAFNMKHTMQGNIVADILPMDDLADYRLGDCLSVVTCLEAEKVVPKSSNMQGRLLKRYKKVLEYLCESKKIDEQKKQLLIMQLGTEYRSLLQMLS